MFSTEKKGNKRGELAFPELRRGSRSSCSSSSSVAGTQAGCTRRAAIMDSFNGEADRSRDGYKDDDDDDGTRLVTC